jgi:3'-phosphoadenosine 5'-phosphosulfate sulfotransferase (PAPS reductase)/FAD synthetase
MPQYHVWKKDSEYIVFTELEDPFAYLMGRGFEYYVSSYVGRQDYLPTLEPVVLANSLEHLAKRRVMCSISGGKDSAAMSLYLTELGIEHERVFMDTGWEAQETYDYIHGELKTKLGPITTIKNTRYEGLADLVLKKGMFPSTQRRFCTEELKMKPLYAYMNHVVDTSGEDWVNSVGIRRDESKNRSMLGEWEWSEGLDAEVWRPLIDWTEQQVIDIHNKHGLKPNPLYLKGARRVGCWPCVFANKANIKLIAKINPARIDLIRELEKKVQANADPSYTPTFFQSPLKHRKGSTPFMAIDDVVAWSQTMNRSTDFEDNEDGCVRWGLCGN